MTTPTFHLPQDETELPLFGNPDIRTPAPVAPGSKSSQAGADVIEPLRKGLRWQVIMSLAAVDHPISREDLSIRTKIKETTLCARLSELRPEWVEMVPNACRSSAGVTVDGYVLTQAGRSRAARSA